MKYFEYIKKHKIIFGLIFILTLILFFIFFNRINSSSAETRYQTAKVEKGNIISSISGSGQVSSSNQIELKPKTSGQLIALNVKVGDKIKEGAIIAQIDASDAYKNVRDARNNLETAKLSLEKILAPSDNLTLLQAQNSLIDAKNSLSNSEDDLMETYDDAFSAVSDSWLGFPEIIDGMNTILYGNTYDRWQQNVDYYFDSVYTYNISNRETLRDNAISSFQTAKNSYDSVLADYRIINRSSGNDEIEKILDKTYKTAKSISEAAKSIESYLSLIKNVLNKNNATLPSSLSTHQSELASYLSDVNSNLQAISNQINNLKSAKQAIVDAKLNINEKEEALKDIESGSDALDIRSAQLTVQQKQNSLADAQKELADFTIRAPFEGTIAAIEIEKGDTVSSATALATIITEQRIAEITLNEVDVAKVNVGQKATLTFDAITDLNLTGTVAEVDTIGTVSQNVVSYNVKINFDTQDQRVKPGMSVSASIITESKTDTLLVPNSAIKSDSEGKYVLMFENPLDNSEGYQGAVAISQPIQQTVEIGITNDDYAEIISGLIIGDQVIIKTITDSSSVSSSQSNNIFSIFGMGGNRTINNTDRTRASSNASGNASQRNSNNTGNAQPNMSPPGF